jgi:acetyl esterase/lipase
MSGPAPSFGVVTRSGIPYATHDGIELTGELYLPQGRDKAPALVAVHGGGWQLGSPDVYRHWGPLLAGNGFALYAIRYRLSKAGTKSYPGAVYDVKAAVQFARANAAQLGLDPDRIGMIGDSAGAHLSALVALAGEEFTSEYRDDPHAAIPADVKAVVGFYGVYDLLAQWQHDQIARPRDQISEKFLGVSPMQSRRTFLAASPVHHVAAEMADKPRFLLIYGTDDEVVDPQSQSQAFLAELKQAAFFARTVVVPGAGHFWAADPIDEAGSYGAQAAPQIVRFLHEAL